MTLPKRMWFLVVLSAALFKPVIAASPSPWEQPSAALAQQISDILGPGQARLTVENLSSIPTDETPAIRKLLEGDLKAHGVIASGAESASSVRVTLSESASERLWVAEMVEGNRAQVTMVDLGSIPSAREQMPGSLMLRSQAVLTAKEPVLAVLEKAGGLVVLEPEQIVFYAHSSTGWQEQKRTAIRQHGTMTRDLGARDPRGVLLAAQGGQGFEAWLSGIACDGKPATGDAAGDWTLECRSSDDPWPIANASSLADPAAQTNAASAGASGLKAFYNGARDYFVGVVTPAVGVDLPPFYTAAPVPRPAGGAALLIGGVDGKVQLVENGALWTIAGTRDWGSDFALVRSDCGAGTQIIASGSGEAAHDSLRAYEIPALEAVPASAPLAVDGMVTALWSAPDGKSAFAVVRSGADQYEVDRVTALCN
jgi:hypothetical protein